jgi:protein kinase C substrate 80K-H
VYRLDDYIPDALFDSYDAVRNFAVEWLIRLGVIDKGSKPASRSGAADGPRECSVPTPIVKSTDVAAARTAYNNVKSALDSLNRDVTSATAALERIEGGFGPDAEWKKLEDTCIEKVAGE